jgi:hypothetical protein
MSRELHYETKQFVSDLSVDSCLISHVCVISYLKLMVHIFEQAVLGNHFY